MKQNEAQQHLGTLDLPAGAPKRAVSTRTGFKVVGQKLRQNAPGLVSSTYC